jgi:DNA-binding IclR family transcriptional regulator
MPSPQLSGIGISLAILEEVARAGPEISANEIAHKLGLPRASAYRQINSLVREEYLLRHPSMRGFVLGARVVELAHLVAPPTSRPELAIVSSVRESIDEAVHYARYEKGFPILIDEDPASPFRSRDRLQSDLTATAIGRLYLSDVKVGEAPPTVDREAHRRIAEATAATGYAQVIGTDSRSRSCLALPVRSRSGILVGALTMSTTASRLDLALRHLGPLRTAASEMGSLEV